MRRGQGLTIVEVLVAIVLLAVLAVAMVAFMPMITSNTTAATTDTAESQMAITVFERIARDWSNPGAWRNGIVYLDNGDTVPVHEYVASSMASIGRACTGTIQDPALERRRVVITCPATDTLPERVIRAEFGDPGV